MTVKELKAELANIPDDVEVTVEIPINGIEFNADIETVYKSGSLYIRGVETIIDDKDAERWWGIDLTESEICQNEVLAIVDKHKGELRNE